jgi:hypothetical protein
VLIDQRKSVQNRSLQSLVIYQTNRANITYEDLAHAFRNPDSRNRTCFGAGSRHAGGLRLVVLYCCLFLTCDPEPYASLARAVIFALV